MRIPRPRTRWLILFLLFLAAVINYLDRQTLSILAPTLRKEFQLSEFDYANAVSAFLLSYTVMYAVSGRLIDWIGVRIGMVACIVWWSLATMLTSLVRGAGALIACRFLLGIGEPGVFPAGLKACAEWFQSKERGLPIGIFSSGSAVGAIVAPPLIAWITLNFGWRQAFLIPGTLGLVWALVWLRFYSSPHPAYATEEGTPVHPNRLPSADQSATAWTAMLKQRRLWALVLSRLASDPVWYFYLFWLPDYLQRERGMSLAQIGFYAWIPFLAADLGGIGGGAFSDWLVRGGIPAPKARLAILVGVGCLAPLGAFSGTVDSTGVALFIVSVVAFLCFCWSTNTVTLASELFLNREIGAVIGMMGTAGSLGGMLFSQLLGWGIAKFGYPAAFMMAAVLHPVAAVTLVVLLWPIGNRPMQDSQNSGAHELHGEGELRV
ncbi:MAG: MFS transporter [Acidobacteria bacterium]|nr:MFS transporter [Acidobacteriota bacterium]MCI0723300.1 MFS transporter [Acidobacteriota bacterium]